MTRSRPLALLSLSLVLGGILSAFVAFVIL